MNKNWKPAIIIALSLLGGAIGINPTVISALQVSIDAIDISPTPEAGFSGREHRKDVEHVGYKRLDGVIVQTPDSLSREPLLVVTVDAPSSFGGRYDNRK